MRIFNLILNEFIWREYFFESQRIIIFFKLNFEFMQRFCSFFILAQGAKGCSSHVSRESQHFDRRCVNKLSMRKNEMMFTLMDISMCKKRIFNLFDMNSRLSTLKVWMNLLFTTQLKDMPNYEFQFASKRNGGRLLEWEKNDLF